MKNAFVAGVVALLLIAIGLVAPLYFTPEPALAQSSAAADDAISSSSTSASATVELQLTIGNFPEDASAGSSVELYLEDDYQVPDDIDPGSIYFIVTNPRSDATGEGRRVYAVDAVEIDDDDHFGGDDDWSIQVFIPDMNTGDDFDGFDGPTAGQTVTMVVTKAAGIKNPSEEGTHSVGYSVLGPTDDNNDGPQAWLDYTRTLAKISLSDEDNSRGYELTVTGSGFNNGTSAAAHVLHNAAVIWWETLDCAAMKVAMGYEADDDSAGATAFCAHFPGYGATVLSEANQLAVKAAATGDKAGGRISSAQAEANEAQVCGLVIVEGHRAGLATVGSDDKVAVTFEVSVPIFGPGNQNYICMIDGEGRASSTDVEQFELEPSIRVSPSAANPGDTVTVFAHDFANVGATFRMLRIAGTQVYPATSTNSVSVTAAPIGTDGSATATFEVPDRLSGRALEGIVRIDATWGYISEDTRLKVASSTDAALLGNPAALRAIGATASAVVIWKPAVSATNHYVYSVRKDGAGGKWTVAAGDADSATVSGLTRGGDYWFIVIAGQDGPGGVRWSAWSNWADASIQ